MRRFLSVLRLHLCHSKSGTCKEKSRNKSTWELEVEACRAVKGFLHSNGQALFS